MRCNGAAERGSSFVRDGFQLEVIAMNALS